MKLNNLINSLFKRHRLLPDIHFDVWICPLVNEKVDKENPLDCCHYHRVKEKRDGTDVAKWRNFEVADYSFEFSRPDENDKNTYEEHWEYDEKSDRFCPVNKIIRNERHGAYWLFVSLMDLTNLLIKIKHGNKRADKRD